MRWFARCWRLRPTSSQSWAQRANAVQVQFTVSPKFVPPTDAGHPAVRCARHFCARVNPARTEYIKNTAVFVWKGL